MDWSDFLMQDFTAPGINTPVADDERRRQVIGGFGGSGSGTSSGTNSLAGYLSYMMGTPFLNLTGLPSNTELVHGVTGGAPPGQGNIPGHIAPASPTGLPPSGQPAAPGVVPLVPNQPAGPTPTATPGGANTSGGALGGPSLQDLVAMYNGLPTRSTY